MTGETKKKLGGLWKPRSENGPPMSGTFQKAAILAALDAIAGPAVRLTIWPNGFKTEDAQPDWNLYAYAPAPRTGSSAPTAPAASSSSGFNAEDHGFRYREPGSPAGDQVVRPGGSAPPAPDEGDRPELQDDDNDLPF